MMLQQLGCTTSQTGCSRLCALRMKTAGRLHGWRLMCLELACFLWSMQVRCPRSAQLGALQAWPGPSGPAPHIRNLLALYAAAG